MILRKIKWLTLLLLHLLTSQAQNARSFDTSDWIPISPTSQEDKQEKRASGRILNLDTPKHRFFQDEYSKQPHFVNENSRKPQYYIRFDQELPQHSFYRPETKEFPVLNGSVFNPGLINREILGAIENNQNSPSTSVSEDNKESIQLVYIPLENLKRNPEAQQTEKQEVVQEKPKHEINRIHHKQHQLFGIEQDFINQALEAHKLQQQIQLGRPIVLQTTTPKPIRKKPHQPPLAVYMESEKKAQVTEVLNVLKEAKSIPVQDNAGPDSPKIFIGPSNLTPQGYTKFPLPYLSNVASNRIERKVDELPFFVAPLSYRAPNGYSKIPLPSPHVGSVVIATKDEPAYPTQNHIQNYQFQAQTPKKIQEYTEEPTRQTFSTVSLNVDSYTKTPQRASTSRPKKVQEYTEEPTRQTFSQRVPMSQNQFFPNSFANLFAPPQSSTPSALRDQFSPTQVDFADLFALQEPSRNQNQYDSFIKRPVSMQFEPPQKPETTQNPYAVQDSDYTSQFIRQKAPLSYNSAFRPSQLKQATNFEPQEINQFAEQNTEIPTGSQQLPAVNAAKTFSSFEKTTTEAVKPKKRQRTKTTTNPTLNYDSSQFTVLEEFPIKPKPTTVKYTTEIETIPAIVYKLNTENPVYSNQRDQILDQQTQFSGPSTESFGPKNRIVYDNEPRTQFLPGLINNLQDQQFLEPNLLLPTTEKLISTTQIDHTSTDYPQTETTTIQQFKRTRGRQRVTNKYSTTPALRRTVSRRRPTNRTTTEIYEEPTSKRQKQRGRTRRPQAKIDSTLISDRIYQTTSTEVNYKQPDNDREPQSYMKFEHVIDDQQVITIKPEQVSSEEHRDYIQPTTTDLPAKNEQEQSPVVDIQITHPLLESKKFLSKQNSANQYVQFSNKGGVLRNEEVTTTTKSPAQIRARTRGRFRFTTTTTEKPTTENPEATQKAEDDFYGFIRQPFFNKPKSQNIISPDSVTGTPSVRFVGEIRPKYQPRISTTARVEEVTTTKAPKIKSRGRIRISNRDKTQYKGAENRKQVQEESRENYPSTYFQSRETTTVKSNFQITVDPYEDDQEPYSSINHPKIVASPDSQWGKSTQVPNVNHVEIEDKKMMVTASLEDAIKTETTTEKVKVTPPKKGRRRGVWKLVKHRPIDSFETAESQNYQSVLNSFGEIQKVSTPVTLFTSPPVPTNQTVTDEKIKENLTTATPTFPEQYTETTTNADLLTDAPSSTAVPKKYQVEPWNMKAIKTVTSTEISHETEICYKGRCIKSKKNI